MYLQVTREFHEDCMFLCLRLCPSWRRGWRWADVYGGGGGEAAAAAALGQALQCQCLVLEVRVLVDLRGTQRVSSVDGGGGRCADVGLVGELGLVLAVVQRG